MAKRKQTCILVLGMHRSGTSALAGVLSRLEVYLGSDLMKADEDNSKGYYENKNFYQINQSLLEQINSSWDDVFYDEEKLDKIVDTIQLKEMIQKEFTYSNLFAIKDPRLVYLFPIYKKILEELDIDIKIVIPYRNPLEVGASLRKRNGISLEKGMLLWIYHILIAEKFSRNHPRFFLSFDDLMTQPQKILKEMSKALDIDLYQRYKKFSKEIDVFLEPSLKHHNIELQNISDHLPSIVSSILEHKINFNESAISHIFDDLMMQFYDYRKLFFNQNLIDEFQKGKKAIIHLYNMNKEHEEKNRELDIQKNVVVEQEDTINELLIQLQEGKNGLNHQASVIDELKAQIVDRDNRVKHQESVISELEDQLQDRQNRVNHQESVLSEKQVILTEQKNTITELLTQLKEGQKALKYQAGVVKRQKNAITKLQLEHDKNSSGLEYQAKIISEYKDQINKLTTQLDESQRVVGSQHERIQELEIKSKKINHNISEYTTKVIELDKENVELKKELIELYSSKSWRWMRFVRKTMRKLK